jgi:hypothetical protein
MKNIITNQLVADLCNKAVAGRNPRHGGDAAGGMKPSIRACMGAPLDGGHAGFSAVFHPRVHGST